MKNLIWIAGFLCIFSTAHAQEINDNAPSALAVAPAEPIVIVEPSPVVIVAQPAVFAVEKIHVTKKKVTSFRANKDIRSTSASWSPNLKIGLILLAIGVGLSVFGLGLVGGIAAIIGLLFTLLGLLQTY